MKLKTNYIQFWPRHFGSVVVAARVSVCPCRWKFDSESLSGCVEHTHLHIPLSDRWQISHGTFPRWRQNKQITPAKMQNSSNCIYSAIRLIFSLCNWFNDTYGSGWQTQSKFSNANCNMKCKQCANVAVRRRDNRDLVHRKHEHLYASLCFKCSICTSFSIPSLVELPHRANSLWYFTMSTGT